MNMGNGRVMIERIGFGYGYRLCGGWKSNHCIAELVKFII